MWCRWDGAHVHVYARLSNGLAAHVNLAVSPKYTIKNGGQHGTSFGSEIGLALDPGQEVAWDGDAGAPAGVLPGTPIDKCEPHLHDISIG